MSISTSPTLAASADWTAVIAPNREDAEPVARELGVPPDFFAHALDDDELPRMESSAGATLIVLRLPWVDSAHAKEPWTTRPVGLVLLPAKVVAISRAEHPVLSELARFAARDAPHHGRLVLRALRLTAEAYLHQLRTINQAVDRLEDDLRLSLENRAVLELLKCQRGLVYFATALRSTELLLERLERSHLVLASGEDTELLEDVRVEIRQALDMTQTSANILSEMMDAFASIISNNLNVVMKFLAAITVVLMIPTMVASFYGMNVTLPFAHSPNAFTMLVIISVIAGGVMALFFVVRRWL